jgi:hypothetical protein
MTEHPPTPNEPVNSLHGPEAPGPEFTAPRHAEASMTDKLPGFPTPHADKFRIALAALIGIAVAAIAIAVVAITSHKSQNTVSTGGSWSEWSPSTAGSTGVEEIAEYVAPFYRFTAAQQLDVVTPLSLTSETDAGTTTGKGLTIAVNTGGSATASSLSLLTGSTAAYSICGIGAKDCDLVGTATPARLLLLRREALELALYTFKYLSSVSNVLVVLPPGHTSSAVGAGVTAAKPVTVSVLFQRAALKPLLATPIDGTLAEDPPAVSQLTAWSKSDEAGLVDELTERGLFSEELEAQQEGGSLIVLTQLPPQ